MSLETFTAAYIECALWAECANTTDSDDRSIGDVAGLAEETRARMAADCAAFYSAYSELITDDNLKRMRGSGIGGVDRMAGHDFWLTRCGHGAGFWDGDWREPAATQLTEAAERAGHIDLYIGDDGLIYQA